MSRVKHLAVYDSADFGRYDHLSAPEWNWERSEEVCVIRGEESGDNIALTYGNLGKTNRESYGGAPPGTVMVAHVQWTRRMDGRFDTAVALHRKRLGWCLRFLSDSY